MIQAATTLVSLAEASWPFLLPIVTFVSAYIIGRRK